jgi:tetratricopeptide (TPR) repeat protein
MFKINIYLKFALIALFLGGGILLWIFQGFWYSFPLLLIGIGLLASYFLLGTIMSAAEMIQETDFAGAEKRLNLTVKPQWLYVTNRAVYYIMRGAIAMDKKDTKGAEELFQTANSMKLPSDNEKAMVLLQLANINATKNKWNAAKNYFREAKGLKVSEGAIKDQLNQFEKALQNQGQMKLARTMGKQGVQMMRGGGSSKRRRPKMR